ncbi:hypothetical protein [Natronobacterium texcoconense]|uniref:Uncharacterized protein n=1 Tax=Natronobacterium texcoconense TaxID=1095778 RepID=A0A1H1IMB4_NATTX|nr:hypothetical protein [Natronobacterium texcoconense]SDR38875.1 hypothetical protein SAMN04489842_3630 [Natronobacterium texcoconense]
MNRRKFIAGAGGIGAATIGLAAFTGSAAAQVKADGTFAIDDESFDTHNGEFEELAVSNVTLAAAWEGFDNDAEHIEWNVEVEHDGETKQAYDPGEIEEELDSDQQTSHRPGDDPVTTEASDIDLLDLFGEDAFDVPWEVSNVGLDDTVTGYDHNMENESNDRPYFEVSEGDGGYGIDITFYNPTNHYFSFDIIADDAEGEPDEWTGEDLLEHGERYDDDGLGTEFGKRYHEVSLDGRDADGTIEETETVFPTESLAVKLERGAEQDWYIGKTPVEFDLDHTDSFDFDFTVHATVTDTEGVEHTDNDADGDGSLTIENIGPGTTAGGDGEFTAEDGE